MADRKWFVVLLVMVFAISLLSAAAQQEQGTQLPYGGVTRISIGASSVGSASYNKLTIWSGYMGQKLGIDIIPEGTAGSVANISLTNAKEVEMGNTMTNIAREAFDGVGSFAGNKQDRIRAVATLDSFALQFYTIDGNGITSIYDLNGKHVNLSRAGSGTDSWARRVFDKLGITPSRISNVNPGEANDLLRDNRLDASGVMGSAHPSIIELNTTHKLNIFGTGDGTDTFLQDYPDLFKVTIADTYDGQKAAFTTMGEVDILIADKDLNEDLVYAITKATYEDRVKLAQSYPGFLTINTKDIVNALIPLHKGSYRYFQEIGVEIPAQLRPID